MSEIVPFKKDLDIDDDSAVNGISHSVPTGISPPVPQVNHFNFQVGNGVGQAERCEECGQWFAGIGQLIKHANRHHSGAGIRSKPYSCKQCNKSFANASYLSQHNRIHQGVRPYKCEQCTKTFTQLSHLQQHKRTHTGEKPYKCKSPGCTKAFSQLSNLQSHTRSHMTDKPFHCNSCYKCFSQQSELDQHRLEHGRSRMLRTHTCKFCGKGYVQIAYLEKHLAKHENEERNVSQHLRTIQHRPHSSLSSTPTTTTSVVPGMQEGSSGPTNQMPSYNPSGQTANNNGFYNAGASPIGIPSMAQDPDRLPHLQSPPHPDFFGASAGQFNTGPASTSGAPPNISIGNSTSSHSATLSSFAIPPLSIMNMLPSVIGNNFEQWQGGHQSVIHATAGAYGSNNWSTYTGPM